MALLVLALTIVPWWVWLLLLGVLLVAIIVN
jgi:hypothetical protein